MQGIQVLIALPSSLIFPGLLGDQNTKHVEKDRAQGFLPPHF